MHVFNSRFQPGDTVWYWAGNVVYETTVEEPAEMLDGVAVVRLVGVPEPVSIKHVFKTSSAYRCYLKPQVIEGAV